MCLGKTDIDILLGHEFNHLLFGERTNGGQPDLIPPQEFSGDALDLFDSHLVERADDVIGRFYFLVEQRLFGKPLGLGAAVFEAQGQAPGQTAFRVGELWRGNGLGGNAQNLALNHLQGLTEASRVKPRLNIAYSNITVRDTPRFDHVG